MTYLLWHSLSPCTHMCERVKQLVLSVSLSVSQSSKNFEISTFTGLKNCFTRQWHGFFFLNVGIDQSISLLWISSSFLFNISIVHHFDTVNHFDTVETGNMQTPSPCLSSPPRHSQDCEKAGQGSGNEATHPWTAGHKTTIWRITSVKKPKHSLMKSISSSWAQSFTLWGLSVTLWSLSAKFNTCWHLLGGVVGWAQE